VLVTLGEQDEAADEVVDVAEAPGLRAVAVHRQRFVLERLAEEGWNCAVVVWPHTGPRNPAPPVTTAVGTERKIPGVFAFLGDRKYEAFTA
jgi:hypothetical protein